MITNVDDIRHIPASQQAVIDKCYQLCETVEDIRRLGEKQSKGKVIITP